MTAERISLDEKVRRASRAHVDSWVPLNLDELPEKPPNLPDLGGTQLIYPSKRHVFSGPPESAKTLAAYCLLLQTVRHDETCLLIDFEMGPYDARQRLRELGGTPDEIARILYVEPDAPADAKRIGALVKLNPALVVVDAAAGAYSLQGLDDNKRADVQTLSRLYVDLFWRDGIATLTIDHATKNEDTRGRFVIGSERKLGAADVHLGFDVVRPISRGGSGLYKITTHKDRGGYLKRGHVADLHLDSDPTTHSIAWRFMTPEHSSDDAPFRPTHLMEKASIYLETHHEAISRSDLVLELGGRRKYALQAIDRLVTEGYAAEESGPRGSRLLSSLGHYREADPDCNPDTPESPAPIVLCSSTSKGE